jgi:hypothetical protein
MSGAGPEPGRRFDSEPGLAQLFRSDLPFPTLSLTFRRCARGALTAALLVNLAGCDQVRGFLQEEEKQAPVNAAYPVAITARRDDQEPVPGVQFLLGTQVLGTTSSAGTVRLSLKGDEGDLVSLTAKCPEAFASPEKPIVVGLRRMASGSPPPKFEVLCVPLLRSIVVGIRTENGANLPIRRLNQVIGQTDAAGVAHVLLQASPREPVTLTLDTRGDDTLRPQNPTLTFAAPDRDELVLLEQKFTVKKRIVHVKPKVIPKPL